MQNQLNEIQENSTFLSIEFMKELSNSFFKAYDRKNNDVAIAFSTLIVEHIENADKKILETKMLNDEYRHIVSLMYYYHSALLIYFCRTQEGIAYLIKSFETNKCCEISKSQENAA